jgi:hypothetical protein
MWSRALMRLFSLSFMALFVLGLVWDEGRRHEQTAGRKPVPASAGTEGRDIAAIE